MKKKSYVNLRESQVFVATFQNDTMNFWWQNMRKKLCFRHEIQCNCESQFHKSVRLLKKKRINNAQ